MTRRLDVYTALWALQPHDPSGVCLSYERVVEMAAEAGYRGLSLDFAVTPAEDIKRVQPMMVRAGLTPMLVDFPTSVEGLRPVLTMAKDFGAPFVVVIGQVMPVTVEGMIPVIRAWLEMSEQEGMPIQFETHRNCITNDLYATLCLLDAIPEMRLCADLSHYVLGREMSCPAPVREQGHIARILSRSDSFQGRIATRQQIQVPLHFPQNRKWIDMFRGWWRDGFADWQTRNDSGTCVFLCELGPPDYAITDAEGRELSNRWDEALLIRSWAEQAWAEAETLAGYKEA